jgi:hypothetical protein
VDEAKETYVKNHLDLDSINENKQQQQNHEQSGSEESEKKSDAPASQEEDVEAASAGLGDGPELSPSAPEESNGGGSHKETDSPV